MGLGLVQGLLRVGSQGLLRVRLGLARVGFGWFRLGSWLL